MSCRVVKLFFPGTVPSTVAVHESEIPSRPGATIYDTVHFFEHSIFPRIRSGNSLLLYKKKRVSKGVLLRNVINLHNHDGIKSLTQIRSMIRQIRSGSHVLSPSGLPNIRLVRDSKGSWVLFDGHHSILAYMFSGKRYLHEVPHIIVENKGKRYATDKEISVFFGRHAGRLLDGWKKYVINWQAPLEKQLCKRVQKNMGELLDTLDLKN